MPSKKRKAQLKRNQVVFDATNDKAKKRREVREDAEREWSKNRSADPMVPYTRDPDRDTRELVDGGPHRAFLHTYGYTRHQRRHGIAAWRREQRRKARRHNTTEFWRVFRLQRLTNEAA